MESANIFVVGVGTWAGLKEELGQSEASVSGDTMSVMEMVALRAGLFEHCPLAMAPAQRGAWEWGLGSLSVLVGGSSPLLHEETEEVSWQKPVEGRHLDLCYNHDRTLPNPINFFFSSASLLIWKVSSILLQCK